MQCSKEWSEKYVTGIYRIDEQNRRLFYLLQDLDAALLERSTEQVQNIAIDLLDYATTDLQVEEERISRSGYPLAEGHCQAHAAFRKRAEHYILQLSDGENPIHLGQQIRHDLNLWITHHIAEEDRHCARFMIRPKTESKAGLVLGWLYS